MLPQLCATVTGRSAAEIRAARDAAADADLVELRLDTMERPDPAAALQGRKLPAIVTCRPVREGGHFRGSEDERRRILEDADVLGAEFIDIEWDAGLDALIRRRNGHGVIVSRHDFSGTPGNVCTMVSDMRRSGAEIVKLATKAHSLSDLLPLLDARSNGDGILIGMGTPGAVSRILAARFGSRWTYAGDGVAPGQLTSAALLQEYRFRRIRPDAAVYGLVGRPVSRSLSAAMHNAGFAALGLNAVYVPLEAADIDDFEQFADRIGLRGASVTIPFKRDVMRLLDDVSPLAMTVGAVNTLLVSDGRWTGTNTDVDGFLEPLRRRTPLHGLRATVLGAGGATRAAAFGLRREGAHVTVAARRHDAAVDVASAVGANAGDWPPPTGSWDILVNATPVGSRDVPGSPIEEIGSDGLVYDLVYDPDPTELMRRGASAGCRVIGGLEMLVAQAERQFEVWTGQRPPADLFAHAATEAIRTRRS